MTANVNGIAMSPFHNPDKQPLEKLELEIHKDGVSRKIPALSKEWTEKRQFLRYEAPQIYDHSGTEIIGAKDRWLELVNYIIKDFEWLLQLPFHKFWSNVIYEPSIPESLVSFLQESPTFYNLEKFPNDGAMRDLLERLARDVLIVFERLVISKASKQEFMSHEAHGNYLYDEFLLTVPMMLDICQLYGRENGKVVEKIISTVMNIQPAYNDDFNKTVKFLIQAFQTVDRRFEDQPRHLDAGAILLSNLGASGHVISLETLEDLVVHLLDIVSNISVFLDVYSPASDLLCTDAFVNEIIHLYGNTIPRMYKRLDTLAFKDETVVKYTELKHFVDVTRIELLKIFRTITYHKIAAILQEPNPSEVPGATEHVEQFVNFLDKAVAEKEFLLDYHVLYSVEADLDLISGISSDIDPVKQQFIKRCVHAQFVEAEPISTSVPRPTNNAMTSASTSAGESSQQNVSVATNDGESSTATKSEATVKTQVELDSLISQVKDILCDLGEGFIEKCLKHYNYNADAVVNAILEDTLPEDLKTLDRSLPFIPPDPEESSAAIDRVLGSERLNVFDNDEFDVMTRDNIDKTRVHKGKRKDKYKNLGQLLDDKSYRKDVGHIYEKFSIIQDEYEDEYDDTYDSHDVGVRGDDEPVEMDGRTFTTPRVLRANDKRDTGGDEEVDEDAEAVDEGSSRAEDTRKDFCQNPAELRARAEQRRMSRGYGPRGGPQSDVVGKPKGAGNTKNVLVNRDKKNTHKASRANHNRRSGAQHKLRQGMVPS